MLWKVSRMVKFGKIMIKKNSDKKYCEKEKRKKKIVKQVQNVGPDKNYL